MKKEIIKNKIRNVFIVIAIMTLIFIAFCKIFSDDRNALYLNWKIWLPKPTNVNTIFQYEYRDGTTFEIWSYEQDIQKFISKKKFKRIIKKNYNEIKEQLTDYYERLDKTNEKLFNENVSYDQLLSQSNYVLYKFDKSNKKSFILIIAEPKSNKLYLFYAVD